jgi:hypothetical protein
MTKIQNFKRVWNIGAWDLGIVCYLLFDAWNFKNNTSTQLRYHFNIHVRHDPNYRFHALDQGRLWRPLR